MRNAWVLVVAIAAMVIAAIIYFGYYDNLQNAANGVTLYVTNGTYGANTIWVINGSGVDTVRVGNGPSDVKLSTDGRYAYVTNSGDGTVSVMDTTTNKVVRTISVGSGPSSIAVNPDGRYVYVLNSNQSIPLTGGYIGKSTISVINTTNFTVTGTIGFNLSTTDLKASSMAIVPNGTELYVAGSYDYYGYNINNYPIIGTNESVWVVNTLNNSVVDTLATGLPQYPRSSPNLAASSSGEYVYLTYGQESFLIATSNKALEKLDFGTTYPYVMSMLLSPNDEYLYESDFYAGQGHFASSFDIFNLRGPVPQLMRSLNLSVGGIATTPYGRLIYVTGYYNSDVMAMSASPYKVVYTTKTGSYPSAIAVKAAT